MSFAYYFAIQILVSRVVHASPIEAIVCEDKLDYRADDFADHLIAGLRRYQPGNEEDSFPHVPSEMFSPRMDSVGHALTVYARNLSRPQFEKFKTGVSRALRRLNLARYEDFKMAATLLEIARRTSDYEFLNALAQMDLDLLLHVAQLDIVRAVHVRMFLSSALALAREAGDFDQAPAAAPFLTAVDRSKLKAMLISKP